MLKPATSTELSLDDCREVAAWIEATLPTAPEPVRAFLAPHLRYLAAEGDRRRSFDTACREICRALRITPSSERRRSGSPLSAIPSAKSADAKTEREKIEEGLERGRHLRKWHCDLKRKHYRRVKRLEKKLATMPKDLTNDGDQKVIEEPEPLEDIELTSEEEAEIEAGEAAFIENLTRGGDADPALKSVNETLMPAGAVLATESHVSLAATLPEALADATVVKTLTDSRTRYDFSVSVHRIDLEVEKKIVVDHEGERHVITASTSEYGPPRYSVTWSALATLSVLVAQFAVPFNRLATMLSTAGRRFSAGALSRMLHYVGDRLVPIYLELANQLADVEVLAGDDTSCRVIEVSTYFAKAKAAGASEKPDKPPWAEYRTTDAAEDSLRRSKAAREARIERRNAGDRGAVRSAEETPSLGVIIGAKLPFESRRKNGDGPKASMNTTVISGRSVADDPRSLIVFYRSHLGGCGNLIEAILRRRDPKHRDLVVQSDLSSTNRVSAPDLLSRFRVKWAGCTAHARRPFAIYEHEDPVHCGHILHLFLGLSMYERILDRRGRNSENVLAIRRTEIRTLWDEILDLAKRMAVRWSKATKLGEGARYIIQHFDALTAYLDDPRLEPTNNLRERMLRMEKLIESSSMFRRSLEGRFVLDVVRTVLQTAVAAGVPVHEYLVSVLRTKPEDVASHPKRFTPRAWAESKLREDQMSDVIARPN